MEGAVRVPHYLVLSAAVWFGSVCLFNGLSLHLPLLSCVLALGESGSKLLVFEQLALDTPVLAPVVSAVCIFRVC